MIEKKKVVLGLSGGLYSSVAAVLLQEQGYEVFGVHLRLGENTGSQCSSVSEEERLKVEEKIEKFAGSLGIPFQVVDVRMEFEAKVVDPARKSFLVNRKTNPCVICHSEIKVGILYEHAKKLGGAWVATGHRARIRYDSDRNYYQLIKGMDPASDHSFFLYPVSQEVLSKVLFPLGTFREDQILKLARAFHISEKNESFSSKNLCFDEVFRDPERMEKVVAPEFLISKMTLQNDTGVEKIDHHHKWKYQFQFGDKVEKTIDDKIIDTYYVKGFKLRPHLVIYGPQSDLHKKEVLIENLVWSNVSSRSIRSLPIECRVQDSERLFKARIFFYFGDRARVIFSEPVLGFFPGKTVVFYKGDECLGGGKIVQDTIDLPALAR
jgi:tRNA-specific 2-thiouridylase